LIRPESHSPAQFGVHESEVAIEAQLERAQTDHRQNIFLQAKQNIKLEYRSFDGYV
jgi:hypothetical protein